ncbi:MAG: glycosyltransferase family 1 protein [Proteobacteria bacterium]|nr:glycosyltransferase family 1 protein [Pseudomonadota bacterium]
MDLSSLVAHAEELYQQRSWVSAQLLYERITALDPSLAVRLSLPLASAHCAIETAKPDQLDDVVSERAAVIDRASLIGRLDQLRRRTGELCAAGDFRRASRLLRLTALYDWSIGYTYKTSITDTRSDCCALLARPPADRDPPFIAEQALSDDALARAVEGCRGMRLLLVFPTTTPQAVRWTMSAEALGLALRTFDSWVPKPGVSAEGYAASLEAEINDFRPAVIAFQNLFETGITSHDAVADGVAAVLETARRKLGCRVVKILTDGWYQAGSGGTYRGLGHAVDLVHHCHPTILERASADELAATFCYPLPSLLPQPSVAYDEIPRAAFAGGVDLVSPARLVWWAELGKRALPIDFDFWVSAGTPRPYVSEAEYANQLRRYRITINPTRRSTGATIMVGRSLETAVSGGFLLEEDSVDTAYFFKRGLHYMPFQTIGDIEEILGALFDDHERRARVAQAAQQWSRRYFTGQYFWAGLVSRATAS